DPRPRLLRRGAAVPPVDRERPGAAGRRTVDARPRRVDRRSRRAGTRVPADPGRAAGGLRVAPLPRAAAGRDRRDARDPGRDGPIASSLRNHRAPRRADRRRRARAPGRTARMTDDRSIDRAARSWLEAGPTQAPDPAVDAALLRIQTTNQER